MITQFKETQKMKLLSITTIALTALFIFIITANYSTADVTYNTSSGKTLVNDNGSDDQIAVKSQIRDRQKDGSCDGRGSGSKIKNGKGNGSGNGTKSRDGSNCDGTGPKSTNPGGNSGK